VNTPEKIGAALLLFAVAALFGAVLFSGK